jgi:hypothetical protein
MSQGPAREITQERREQPDGHVGERGGPLPRVPGAVVEQRIADVAE